MSRELNLQFPDKDHVIVHFDGENSGVLSFTNPLTAKDRQDIQWYLEVYGAHSLGDPDDAEAARIATQLPAWGKALFNAVFHDRAAERLFNRFQDSEDEARVLTISAEHPAVLALPWELLHDPSPGGVFLFNENPRVSIRRRVAGATGGRRAFKAKAKERLHLLFVVSRPSGSGFLDPRADAQAVLYALEQSAPGRFTWEFLRPATIDALVERLEDSTRPAVDILHFDGHGVFDRHGGLPERVAEKKHAIRFPLEQDVFKDEAVQTAAGSPANTGYLLFEKPNGESDFIPAQRLGDNLHRHKVALIILSACQTAALGDNDEPMGSVAARLTAAGTPAVLAMTHSVLTHTTRALFGAFYKELARGRGIGEALDNARRHLVNNPEKYEVQRGPNRVVLKLHDWFLPALYQSGADVPLLQKSKDDSQTSTVPQPRTNLPARPESGFFGRRRELWDIERWFTDKTRRITITGFGGQGKTALAEEAGRWLTRTGMFQAAVMLRYNQIPSSDAVGVAVSTLGSVLGETLIDATAATAALKKTPTLVILDNLEALAPGPLRQLLDAAVAWSEAGGSRVLCTARTPDFDHPDYRVEGTLIHRRSVLAGLGHRDAPDDALEWFAELMKLPPPPTVPKAPAREALIELFDRVKFHPLSPRVLAGQLKIRRPAELGLRLEQLLAAPSAGKSTGAGDETVPELVASLQLSLDRLDEAARRVLPRLGVFQGGALEPNLLAITEIEEQVWPTLRRQLQAAALIEAETLPGVPVPFLRFHPTLAPLLWVQLSADEQARLSAAHRQCYYAAAGYLYQTDIQNPHEARVMVLRELPNLLHAVYAALDADDSVAVNFANRVNNFLDVFGFRQESEALIAKAQAMASEAGSYGWYVAQSNRGQQLLKAGRMADAAEVFHSALEKLRITLSYERAVTLTNLGRCFAASGRSDVATQYTREACTILEELEQTNQVKRLHGVLMTDLADGLVEQGQFAEARKAYEAGLEVFKELGDISAQGATVSRFGTLAMQEGKLNEAVERYRAALGLFQQLREPASEAVMWHQLGNVFQEARQWDEAERHYREAARLEEQQGNLGGAAQTWSNLAVMSKNAGKLEAAERWHQKVIEAGRKLGNPKALASYLHNFAFFLQNLPGRLAEARQLAEEALAIKQTLDPSTEEIWKTYYVLARIAENEAQAVSDGCLKMERQAQAREYRRLARSAEHNVPGASHKLQKLAPLILATVQATRQPEDRKELEQLLLQLEQRGLTNLVDAIRRLLAGEQSAEILCEGLEFGESRTIEAILHALGDPSTLQDLLPEQVEK
jgi:tetratricopeptide (TPR) repeat protein